MYYLPYTVHPPRCSLELNGQLFEWTTLAANATEVLGKRKKKEKEGLLLEGGGGEGRVEDEEEEETMTTITSAFEANNSYGFMLQGLSVSDQTLSTGWVEPSL